MKTAVEWFLENLRNLIKESELTDMRPSEFDAREMELLEQAKEMEMEQSLKMPPYDLDNLASKYSEGKSEAPVFKRAHESDFKAGFQKAIELLTFKQQEQ
jgi:hypothetical protein